MRIAREAPTLLHDVGLIRPLDGWPKHPYRQTPLSPCLLVLCVRVRVGLALVDPVTSRARVFYVSKCKAFNNGNAQLWEPRLYTHLSPLIPCHTARARTRTHTRLIFDPPIILSSHIDSAKATDRDLRPSHLRGFCCVVLINETFFKDDLPSWSVCLPPCRAVPA